MKIGKRRIVLGNAQHVGGRREQQDYMAIVPVGGDGDSVDGVWLIVADGMGGHEGGASASVVAVDSFSKKVKGLTEISSASIKAAIEAANDAVIDWAQDSDGGTTIVVLYLSEHHYWFGSVGDSRIFLRRHGVLHRLNHDHNLGAQLDRLVAEGKLDPQEANADGPERRYLTSYLGKQSGLLVEVEGPREWQAGDSFILASDGLSDALSNDEIANIGFQVTTDVTYAEALVNATVRKQRPGQDNVTAVTVNALGDVGAASGRKVKVTQWLLKPVPLVLFAVAALLIAGAVYLTFVRDGTETGEPAVEEHAQGEVEAEGKVGEPEDGKGDRDTREIVDAGLTQPAANAPTTSGLSTAVRGAESPGSSTQRPVADTAGVVHEQPKSQTEQTEQTRKKVQTPQTGQSPKKPQTEQTEQAQRKVQPQQTPKKPQLKKPPKTKPKKVKSDD